MSVAAGIAAIAALVTGLVVCELRGAKRGGYVFRYVFKPAASAGFLFLAIGTGALESGNTYGQLILVGLVLSFFGDVFLLSSERPALFLAGLGSFLLGHVAYAVAFGVHGIAPGAAIAMGVALVPVAGLVWRWLKPHLPADMVAPVIAYIVVISSMEALATGAALAAGPGWRTGGPLMLLGATLFWVSDLAVARRQFVDDSPISSVWGLPLYYAGQVLLALSVIAGRPIVA
jgi:uncharacterized membrane protein YhhN